jgi:hypothetical protein
VHKLDVAAVSRRIFGVLLDGPFLSRATGAWFALLTVIGWVTLAVKRWAVDGVVAQPIGGTWATLALIVDLIAVAARAVNVHRFILLAERPAPLRFGRTEWRYFWRGVWVFLPIILFFIALAVAHFVFNLPIIFGLLKGWSSALAGRWGSYALALTWLGSQLVIGSVALPLFMSLPAVAIGRADFTMSDGLEVISGNFLRLLAIFLIAFTVPASAVELVANGIEKGISILATEPTFLLKVIEVAVEAGREVLRTVMWAAMLSCAYAGLVERNRDLMISPQDADA